jgi:hypothetical protein
MATSVAQSLYGCHSGKVPCGCGFAGERCVPVGANGFVQAFSANRTMTQIIKRYFIKPPFLESDSSARFVALVITTAVVSAEGELGNALKSIGRAAWVRSSAHGARQG